MTTRHLDQRVGGESHSNIWLSTLTVPTEELNGDAGARLFDTLDGWSLDTVVRGVGGDSRVIFMPKPNLVVNVGVQRSLDRHFAINGPPGAIVTMGVDDGSSNPVAGTTSSSAGSTNRRLVSFDSTPTRAAQTVSASGTFTNATVSFIMKRLFLSAQTAGTTDAAGTLVAMTNVFTIDLSSFSSWNQTFTTQYTGTGS